MTSSSASQSTPSPTPATAVGTRRRSTSRSMRARPWISSSTLDPARKMTAMATSPPGAIRGSLSAKVVVPLLDLQAQFHAIRDDILAAMTRVADSQRFILGSEVDAFEREIAAALEVEHAIGVSSGTDALLVALMALGVGPGDEVITSTYSFFATAGCVARLGATPVFVDIDPVTFNLDPAA